jgi:PKD domain-containing protein
MKKLFAVGALTFYSCLASAQEVLRLQNGATVTIQNGVNLVLQGGITLENGSSLENKGFLFLKNNTLSNTSNWNDNSASGALSGTGVVVFNSDHPQQFTGLTNFYTVAINTNDLTLNDNLNIANLLRLVNGKINTGTFYVFLNNNLFSALETDVANSSYANSWINGTFRRLITSNTGTYDFPVGISTRSNLLKFVNNNIVGPTFLTASFGTKSGTDAGLNVTENGNTYTAVNNGGVWYLVPDAPATGGNYALQLYFNGFTGLTDNQFGILRRPDASTNAADWSVPAGSSLEPLNGAGRKVSDGFARRSNISNFSQLGIGQFTPAAPAECSITGQSQVCSSSTGNTYSGPAGMTTYNWTLSGAGVFVGANNTQTVTVNALSGPSSFTLTLNTTLNESSAQCSKVVQVNSTPVCDITGPNAVCVLPLPLQNNSYTGPTNMTTYSWTINPGSTGATIVGSNTAQSVNVAVAAPGTFTLTLDATANGCTSHCSKSVTANPLPPCDIIGSSSVTAATTGISYTASPNMDAYNWSISGNGSIVGSTTSQSVSVTAGAAGSFTLTSNVTLNGCTSTCTKSVTVNPSSAADCSVTGASEVCAGSTSNTYTAPVSMTSYSWSVSGNGTISGSSTNQTVTVTAGSAGSFTLTLNTTLNEASAQCSKTVTVKALPGCDITGSLSVTAGTTDNIYTAPLNMSSYNWVVSGNGAIVGSNNSQSVNVTAGTAGSYTLTLTTTLNGCGSTCTKTVTVNPSTSFECAITGQAEICTSSTPNTYSGPAGMSTYNWSITGNGTIVGSTTNASVTITANAPGSFSVTLQTTLNGIACSYTKTVIVKECVTVCSYTQGFYGNNNGLACLDNSGVSATSSQMMLTAFGADVSRVFGNVSNRRFFTLYESDITSGAIYRMLPGGGNPSVLGLDNTAPYDGATYTDVSTWKLVPIQPGGPQVGKIKNSLLAQTIVLWFNLRISSSLGSISLIDDTLITRATSGCGSHIPIGDSLKFGLPHSVIVYLNGANGYSPTITGLFQLANDVLGGVNTAVTASDIQRAVDAINNAFDECRILVGTIPYSGSLLTTAHISKINELTVLAYPNPYTSRFNLSITSPVSGDARIEFFTPTGSKLYEMKTIIPAKRSTSVPYPGPVQFGAMLYKVSIDKYQATGIVIKPN